MRGKIEVMDDIGSQAFARKLEQYFSIFIPQIQVKSQNQIVGKVCVFCKKQFLRGGIATQLEPSKKELHRSNFEELAFWLIEVIEAAAFE